MLTILKLKFFISATQTNYRFYVSICVPIYVFEHVCCIF